MQSALFSDARGCVYTYGMKTHYKFALVALPLAIITFILSRVIWPDPSGMVGPDATLLPHFIFLSALESLAFGVGVAFALFGYPRLRASMPDSWLSSAAFIAIVWALVSWWPHDNMHRVNGMSNFAGLLRIEYIFHFTLIIAGCIVAMYFWKQLTRSSAGAA